MRHVLLVVSLVIAVSMTGCALPSASSPHPGVVSSSPALLTMPDLVGQNADVAKDKLKKLGFTNVDLGTVDGHKLVILPQNWTVKTQSAKPGERLTPDAKIVLGCARIG